MVPLLFLVLHSGTGYALQYLVALLLRERFLLHWRSVSRCSDEIILEPGT
jgi:hypothetical protein